jgi:hypothetical protein
LARALACATLEAVRLAATALLVLLLGQALGLPAFEGRCALSQCSDDATGTCATPCEACLCCAPVRTMPALIAALPASNLVATSPLAPLDTIPPDSPPHEILHVPKA